MIINDDFCQFTISTNLKAAQTAKLVSSLLAHGYSKSKKVRVIFVVPDEETYNTMPIQKYLVVGGKRKLNERMIPKVIKQSLEQWVLYLPAVV